MREDSEVGLYAAAALIGLIAKNGHGPGTVGEAVDVGELMVREISTRAAVARQAGRQAGGSIQPDDEGRDYANVDGPVVESSEVEVLVRREIERVLRGPLEELGGLLDEVKAASVAIKDDVVALKEKIDAQAAAKDGVPSQEAVKTTTASISAGPQTAVEPPTQTTPVRAG